MHVSDLENSIVHKVKELRIQGVTSGATVTMFRFNTSLQYLHIENISGNFQNSEIITIEKKIHQHSSTIRFKFWFTAQQGQRGLTCVKSGTTTLNATGIITLAAILNVLEIQNIIE